MSLLAVSFAFGLATLGSALAVSERAYLVSAVDRERAIIDRITLESAAALHSGELAVGRVQPLAPHDLETIALNGRTISTHVSLPEGKWDLAMDTEKTLNSALEAAMLPKELVDFVASSPSVGLAEASRALRLSASEEDCLRHAFTLGRAPETLSQDAMPGVMNNASRKIGPGDQIDLRMSLDRSGTSLVLWSRARFFSSEMPTWIFHDDRSLKIDIGHSACSKLPTQAKGDDGLTGTRQE